MITGKTYNIKKVRNLKNLIYLLFEWFKSYTVIRRSCQIPKHLPSPLCPETEVIVFSINDLRFKYNDLSAAVTLSTHSN